MTEDELAGLRRDISNRACHDIAPIADEEFDVALRSDDALFNWLMATKKDAFTDYISRAFKLDRSIVVKITERDTIAWKNAVIKGEALRWDSLRTKVSSRFEVYRKNLSVIRELDALCSEKTGYLDVGCGLGFTMMAARELGFEKAHGVEVDPAFATTGLSIIRKGTDGEIGYVAGDFMTECLSPPYSLITFFDVLEHVAEIDSSIDRACQMTSEKGLIFFYQGNARSIPMVLSEPHYRVPFLTIMPKEIVIRVLMKRNRITRPDEYVVNNWPDITTFSKRSWPCALVGRNRNYRSGAMYLEPDAAVSAVAGFQEKFEEEILSLLDAGDRQEAQTALNEYVDLFHRKLDGDKTEFRRQYLMSSWSMVMARDVSLLGHALEQNADLL